MLKLTLVIPCYNEQENIIPFYKETEKYINDLECEVEYLFVDDGSSDDTLRKLHKVAQIDERVRYISFSRNFGKEAAMLAGFQHSTSDAVIVLDADLQHPPSLIPELWSYYLEGYDQVIAKRNRKGEGIVRSGVSRMFYRIANSLIEVELDDGVGDFRLLSRKALDSLLELTEYNRFSKGIFSWIGFKDKVIEYENQLRETDESKWSFKKLLDYGIDGILSFNNKPLRISIYIGSTITLLGSLYILIMLVNYMKTGVEAPGYLTTISSIIIIGGIQLLFLGIIGEYIGRIYYEVKDRPHYLIKESNIDKELEEYARGNINENQT